MCELDQQTATVIPLKHPSKPSTSDSSVWKRLRGGILLTIGFLLSPLSWWNDLIFNLPVAYGFGYLCSWFSSSWLIPGMIVGYWISNILGILLMQAGVLDLAQGQPAQRNFQKELLTGVVSSTIYTLLIIGLVHFKVLETPLLFVNEQLSSLNSWLPW